MAWRGILVLAMMGLYATARAATPQDAPFESPTVRDFLGACTRDMSQCDYEIRAVLLDKLHARDATSVCLKGAHYQQAVISWLQDHSETWPMATEDGVYAAFRSLYPCP